MDDKIKISADAGAVLDHLYAFAKERKEKANDEMRIYTECGNHQKANEKNEVWAAYFSVMQEIELIRVRGINYERL
jgi:ATP-dependent helicase/DNAse subunit B